MNEITNEMVRRWWDNLAADGQAQAINILILLPEQYVGDSKEYIKRQILEFDKFYNMSNVTHSNAKGSD